MSTPTLTIPQPLTGSEIRLGIAKRISASVPSEHAESVEKVIFDGLGRTCSLSAGTAYAKFKAEWNVWLKVRLDTLLVDWVVRYELDDFGRITKAAFGENMWLLSYPESESSMFSGEIPEMPPDKFRRETEQPIPKPTELKKPDEPQVTMSRSVRGTGKRRQV